MENKKILFIYDGKPHYCHKRFADTIGADFFDTKINEIGNKKAIVRFLKKVPRDYDIYITEGIYSYGIIAKKLKIINGKVINLFSDPRLHQIVDEKMFDFKKNKVVKYPFFKKIIAKYLINSLDGAVCGGKLETALFEKVAKKIPVKTIYPFIPQGRRKLANLKRKFQKDKVFLFIGYGPDYYQKGVDIMIDAFTKLDCCLDLHIIGNWKKFEKEYKNIKFLGKMQNFIDELKKSSFGIHLGQSEAFGVSILEMMLSGLPVIISNKTGAKEAVEKVDKKLIINLDEENVVEKIKNISKIQKKEWEKLSIKSRKTAIEFTEDKMLKFFKKQFRELLNEIF